MAKYWNIRSRWDYIAFIALAQWCFIAVAAAAFAFSVIFAAIELRPVDGWFLILAFVFGGAVFIANALAFLTPLATVNGSKHHPHMRPGVLYHLLAFFFGPIVGVHYLNRTRKADLEEPSVG